MRGNRGRAQMARSIFDENGVLTEEGKGFDARVREALRPIFADAEMDGLSLRDMQWLASHSMSLEVAMAITSRMHRKQNDRNGDQ